MKAIGFDQAFFGQFSGQSVDEIAAGYLRHSAENQPITEQRDIFLDAAKCVDESGLGECFAQTVRFVAETPQMSDYRRASYCSVLLHLGAFLVHGDCTIEVGGKPEDLEVEAESGEPK